MAKVVPFGILSNRLNLCLLDVKISFISAWVIQNFSFELKTLSSHETRFVTMQTKGLPLHQCAHKWWHFIHFSTVPFDYLPLSLDVASTLWNTSLMTFSPVSWCLDVVSQFSVPCEILQHEQWSLPLNILNLYLVISKYPPSSEGLQDQRWHGGFEYCEISPSEFLELQSKKNFIKCIFKAGNTWWVQLTYARANKWLDLKFVVHRIYGFFSLQKRNNYTIT